MRYIKHNIYSNIDAASKSKDMDALRNIMVDQVSEIISAQPVKLISVMKDAGISLSKKPTNRELINKVVLNIDKNTKFKNSLAELIASNNPTAKKSAASGQNTDSGSAVISNSVDQLYTGTAAQVKDQKQQTSTELINLLASKTKAVITPKSSFGLVVLMTGFIAAIYFVNKKQ